MCIENVKQYVFEIHDRWVKHIYRYKESIQRDGGTTPLSKKRER